ncbi:uncharacterized protein Dana_GF26440 [Drosophila ananassae]|uniref:Uncharacterized protein n=1 Tax=Drosophila ananassae TaxID=7217 RepID=A0A0N8P0J2_DROAN|nr:uncharacterized protein LOC26513849 [Drosophila ananassae]KPU77276.1 uncharacterized protein Dana_GF26440 [Drosophila ananassae]
MAKSYYLAIFPMALAIFSVCNANEDVDTIKKGIESLSNTMIKYQSEFDSKVKFRELQAVIDTIDDSMLGYKGIAVRQLDRVRSLNSKARTSYSNCVKPVFEWCIGTNDTFHTMIPLLRDNDLSQDERRAIFTAMLNAIDMGLKHTENSLNILNDVVRRTTDLKDLFQSIKHDIANDFGEDGYYGKKKNDLENRERIYRMYIAIGLVIFSDVGQSLKFAELFGGDSEQWRKSTSFEDQLKEIETFFHILLEKISNASVIVQNINSALEEDKTNLYVLRGKLSAADMNKILITLDTRAKQNLIIPSFTNVADQCTKYVTWHGYNTSIYDDSKGIRRVVLFSISPLIDHLDDKPQTVLASELEQVEDPKQVKHVPEDEGNPPKIESPPSSTPPSSTPPSNIHFVATFFKHVV